MTIAEFVTVVNDARAAGKEHVLLTVVRAREPRGRCVRLAPGLTGVFVLSNLLPDGQVKVVADCALLDVECWLAKNGATFAAEGSFR